MLCMRQKLKPNEGGNQVVVQRFQRVNVAVRRDLAARFWPENASNVAVQWCTWHNTI